MEVPFRRDDAKLSPIGAGSKGTSDRGDCNARVLFPLILCPHPMDVERFVERFRARQGEIGSVNRLTFSLWYSAGSR